MVLLAAGLVACGSPGGTSAAAGNPAGTAASPQPSRPPAASLPSGVLASIPVSGGPLGMVEGAGSLWVTAHRDTLLYRIDPSTNTVIAKIDVGQPTCGGPDFGFGRVWIGSCERVGKWVLVDSTTNQLTGTVGCGGLNLAFGAGSAWCPEGPQGQRVTRIDPTSLKSTAAVQLGSTPVTAVFAGNAVWVANFDGTVSRIDPATNKVVASVPAGVAGADSEIIHAAFGAVWVTPSATAASDNSKLWRIDTASNAVQQLTVPGTSDLGADQGDMADGMGSLWLDTSDTSVTRLDPSTGQAQGTYPRGAVGSELVAFGSLWVSNVDLDSVWRVRVSA